MHWGRAEQQCKAAADRLTKRPVAEVAAAAIVAAEEEVMDGLLAPLAMAACRSIV